ncbi:ROK family transcriptional regulator [Spirochaeta dissipatitropha]
MKRTGDNDFIKELNYKLILDAIRIHEPISRVELSRLTGLTRSTCTLICERMIRQGIIMETGKGDSTGGRPRILLQLNPEVGVVLGFKLMDDGFSCASVDLRGGIFSKQSQTINKHSEPEYYLNMFDNFVEKCICDHKNAYAQIPVLGLGLGLGGRISSADGIVLDSSILGWKNVSIGPRLEEKFGLPVFVENDVNTFAIGEKYFGAGKAFDNFLCVSVGEGIGLGIILDGNLLCGAHHGAGEIGHIKVTTEDSAPICACSRRGCLEAFTADRALIEAYHSRTGKHILPEALTDLAQDGDSNALEVFAQAGTYLGIAISTLINLFDPQALIIGGERANAAPYFLPNLKEAVRKNAVYGLADEVEIIALQPGNDDWIRGVAALAIREIFAAGKLLEV